MSGQNGAANANRIRTGLLLALVIALALGSFWFLQVVRNANEALLTTAPSNKPDYYIDQFVYVKMSPDGAPRYSITGTRMEHYPLSDSYQVDAPFIKSLDKAKPPMVLRSDKALIEDANTKIHMRGHAFAERDAVGKAAKLTVTSEYLLLLPDEDEVRSDQPVRIKLGESVLDGTGMIANNAKMSLTLLSQVHGIYAAAKPH
jgi:lipopolysaccharide export system protein LptC